MTTPIGRGAAVASLAAASVALLESARRHQQGGDLDAAAADIERALAQEPNQARLWLELAEIRLRQNRRDQARTLLHRAEAAGIADAASRQRALALRRRIGD